MTPMANSARQGDRLLRAVLLSGERVGLEFAGDLLRNHDAVAEFVGVENVRRQAVAAPMAGTAVGVDGDSRHGYETGSEPGDTGKISGSDSTDLSAAV